MRPGTTALALLLAALGTIAPCRAQAPASTTAPAETAQPWLGDRAGIQPLQRALLGGDARERERAIERLGALGTSRALELLVRALEPSGAAQTARERLLCVRVLAAHVAEPKVRESLVRVMSGISVSVERNEPLYALLRDTAAFALSASADPAALEALGKALRQPGRVAQAAAAAVVGHPPRDLGPLLAPLRTPTPELVWVLETLGDERGFEALRQIVRRGAPELRARAALALTRLGNFETVELARHWAKAKPQPALLVAAAEILTLAREREAIQLVNDLLEDPATRTAALELVVEKGDAKLTRRLFAVLESAEPHEISLVLERLVRSGDDAALERLAAGSLSGGNADAAAYALALAPRERATELLGHVLEAGDPPRRIVRAALLRRAALGDDYAVRGVDEALEKLLRSRDRASRAVGAFGRALSSAANARLLLRSRDALIAEAAARAAPFVGAAREAAELLVAAPPGPLRSQLALALIDDEARAAVPTRVLLDLIAEAGPAAPIALFALGARDGEVARPTLAAQLASPDPERRAHAALGLGDSHEASALGLLESAYRFEIDPNVRHAIVIALARRPEAVRRRTLELAARLDPNERARNAAALARSGVRPDAFVRGVGTVWLTLRGAQGSERLAVKLQVPGGLALPVLADPDGVVALAGLPPGSIALRLARGGGEGNATARDPERR
jgi:HEAT repeat protein